MNAYVPPASHCEIVVAAFVPSLIGVVSWRLRSVPIAIARRGVGWMRASSTIAATGALEYAATVDGPGLNERLAIPIPADAPNGDLPIVVQLGNASSAPALVTVQR